jgi:hypothetical protein
MSNYLYIIGYDTKLLEFDLNSNSVTNQFNIPVRGYQITLVGNILNIVEISLLKVIVIFIDLICPIIQRWIIL